MVAKRRLPLAEASALAGKLVELLRSGCERIEIAGSVRRGSPTVGDLEIVAVPKLHWPTDLFGGHSGHPVDLLDQALGVLMSDGWRLLETPAERGGYPESPMRLGIKGPVVIKDSGARWGPRFRQFSFEGLPVDLFIVRPPAQWGVLLLIRTGPREFSRRAVTRRSLGGLLPDYAVVREGGIYRLQEGTVIPTPEEEDVFSVLGVPWIAPGDRG